MKTILIATIGKTPAVLTETVWALAVNGKKCIGESIVPDNVFVFTYNKCFEPLCKAILTSEENVACGWDRLKENLLKHKIRIKDKLKFGEASILTYRNGSAFVNEAFEEGAVDAIANTFVKEIKALRDNTSESVRIIASVSGGRKTDGTLLMSCMGLLGQEGDKVVHLIPSLRNQESFSALDFSNPKFLFPEDGITYSFTKADYINQKFSEYHFVADDVKLNLFEVPLLMTGKWYKSQSSLNRIISFSDLINEQMLKMETSFSRPKVTIDFDKGQITIDGKPAKNNKKPIRQIEFFVLSCNSLRQKETTPQEFKDFVRRIQQISKTDSVLLQRYKWMADFVKEKGPFRGGQPGKCNTDLLKIGIDIRKHCAGIVDNVESYVKIQKDLISNFEEAKAKLTEILNLVEFKMDNL